MATSVMTQRQSVPLPGSTSSVTLGPQSGSVTSSGSASSINLTASTSVSSAGSSQTGASSGRKKNIRKSGSPSGGTSATTGNVAKRSSIKTAKGQKHYDSVGGCTSKYIRMKTTLPTTQAALDAANVWILNNKKSIDDLEQYYCPMCGQVELTICGCHLKSQNAVELKAVQELPLFPRPLQTVLKGEKHWFAPTGSFNAQVINNEGMLDLENSAIKDDFICGPMYNYIRIHMSLKYGSRSERYTHCHKLALKFLELKKFKLEDMSALQTNMILVTVQRVTDQIESQWLATEFHNIPEGFLGAWLRKLSNWYILFPVLLLLTAANWLLLKPLKAVYSNIGYILLLVVLSIIALGYLGLDVQQLVQFLLEE